VRRGDGSGQLRPTKTRQLAPDIRRLILSGPRTRHATWNARIAAPGSRDYPRRSLAFSRSSFGGYPAESAPEMWAGSRRKLSTFEPGRASGPTRTSRAPRMRATRTGVSGPLKPVSPYEATSDRSAPQTRLTRPETPVCVAHRQHYGASHERQGSPLRSDRQADALRAPLAPVLCPP
jgi:hypothetical protein